jgi:hypothetical protein
LLSMSLPRVVEAVPKVFRSVARFCMSESAPPLTHDFAWVRQLGDAAAACVAGAEAGKAAVAGAWVAVPVSAAGFDGEFAEDAAAAMMPTQATPMTVLSTLCRAGQDLRRGGCCGGCGGAYCGCGGAYCGCGSSPSGPGPAG